MRQKDPNRVSPTLTQTRDDNFNSYRQLCETRLKRLERYKKTKSFCSLDASQEAEASTSSSSSVMMNGTKRFSLDSDSGGLEVLKLQTEAANIQCPISNAAAEIVANRRRTPYDLLREKMISLMENDVELLQKLLRLGETIQELREKPLQRSTSEHSLSSSMGNCEDNNDDEEDEENEDELRPMAERQNKFSASMSAITNLYLEDEEMENRPNFQYFSRKNSVLRIPIPPRASNRMLGKKIPRRPSELLRPGTKKPQNEQPIIAPASPTNERQQQSPSTLCHELNVNDEHNRQVSAPNSSQTSPSSSSTSATTNDQSTALPNHSNHDDCSSSTLSSRSSNADNHERKATLSEASLDSGIRDDDCPTLTEDLLLSGLANV